MDGESSNDEDKDKDEECARSVDRSDHVGACIRFATTFSCFRHKVKSFIIICGVVSTCLTSQVVSRVLVPLPLHSYTLYRSVTKIRDDILSTV